MSVRTMAARAGLCAKANPLNPAAATVAKKPRRDVLEMVAFMFSMSRFALDCSDMSNLLHSSSSRASEIRFVRSWDRFDVETEIAGVVLGADIFDHRTLRDAAVVLHPAPRRREGARIFNGRNGFQP